MIDLRRRGPLLGVALGLLVLGAFVVQGLQHPARPVDRGTVPAAPAASATPVPKGGAAPALETGSLPSALSITHLHVQAPVVPVAVGPGGELGVPDDPRTIGWWAGGAAPGASSGTVVLDGHVDTAEQGAGALFRLRDVSVGDTVTVAGDPSTVTYRITGVREYGKGVLPARQLFVQTGAPRLVLVTCGGPFNSTTRHYRDNIVAYGVQVP